MTPTYRRAPRCVFRWVRGTVLLAGPERDAVILQGVAALAWMVLEEPATAAVVGDRIMTSWTGLVGSDRSLVDDALGLLVANGALLEGAA